MCHVLLQIGLTSSREKEGNKVINTAASTRIWVAFNLAYAHVTNEATGSAVDRAGH